MQVEQNKQKGFVSLIVAATIMILLSLVTIGFTRVMQQEYREALDRQLTRQATYAAESGINSVWQFIRDDGVAEEKTECSDDGNVFQINATESIEVNGITPSAFFDTSDPSSAIQITCVLYDNNPPLLVWTVGEGEEYLSPIEDKDGAILNTISVSWRGDLGGVMSGCSSGENFAFPETHNGIPMLRMDLYNTSSFERDRLANSSQFLYLIPCDSGADTGANSVIVDGNRSIKKTNVLCSNDICSVSLNVSSLGSTRFFVRHKLLYGSGRVEMSATTDIGETAELINAQSMIDVTARSTDVVRRLRANIPRSTGLTVPPGVISFGAGGSSGLCKDLDVLDAGPTSDRFIRDNCN